MHFFLFFVYLFLVTNLLAQNEYSWKNYTGKNNISGLTVAADHYWASTSGGVFRYLNGEFLAFTKSEGLNSHNITAISSDASGVVWAGDADGVVHVIFNDNSILKISDISRSGENNNQINKIVISGSTAYICTAFGVTLISTENFQIKDTFFKFGDFPSKIQVFDLLADDRIFVVTENGIAISNPGAVNLSAPDSWQIYSYSIDLNATTAKSISKYGNLPVLSSDKGIFSFTGSAWQQYRMKDTSLIKIVVSQDTLWALTQNSLIKLLPGTRETVFSITNSLFTDLKINEDEKILGTTLGFHILRADGNQNILVPGPRDNLFAGIAVGENSVLYASSGRGANGPGIYIKDGEEWSNFNISNTPSLLSNAYHNTTVMKDGSVCFANWGKGYALLNQGNFSAYNADSTGMTGIVKDPKFLVISDIQEDSKGDRWFVNFESAATAPISKRSSEGVWNHYQLKNPLLSTVTVAEHLLIDQYDTKWFALTGSEGSGPGLVYFMDNKTADNLDDDEWGIIKETDGLTNNKITSLALDQRGEIWVGTDLGVSIITDPSNPDYRISSAFALRQQAIKCIAVDPLNQKWVGTIKGVFLVSSDGSDLIAQFNATNSPLPSDLINDIAIDPNSGIVYVSTDQGLTMIETPFPAPLKAFGEIEIYPNPFKPDGSNYITIDGLIRDAQIKVLTISGKLVTAFESPGGRVAFWNGTDFSGKPAPSSIYLIVAYDRDAKNVATAKLALIR